MPGVDQPQLQRLAHIEIVDADRRGHDRQAEAGRHHHLRVIARLQEREQVAECRHDDELEDEARPHDQHHVAATRQLLVA